ncbi:MAG TPA: hypothetical protein PLN85_01985 [archaeon]|nr:hypothetical protein [archaeon]
MIIYVDIDNTICYTNGNDYVNSIPNFENIKKVNKLYDDGNIIIYWTGRGMKSGLDWTNLTKKQLSDWGCKYNELIMNNKPAFDLLIDDKAIKIDEL